MNTGGRMWRVDLAAIVVATAVVALFVLTMALEQILPDIGGDPQRGLKAVGTAMPDCHAGRVALTFDGGPDPEVTPQLLDLLKAKRIVTTFFVDPARAARDVGLLRRIGAEGHQTGLYVPPAMPDGAARPTLAQSVALFTGNGLPPPRLVRPEGTTVNDVLRWSVSAAGLTLATDPGALDVADRDLAAPQTIQQHIVDGVGGHRVFIAHDTAVPGLNTTAALSPTIDDLQGRGYCFARLDDVDRGRSTVVLSGPEGTS